MKKFFVHCLYGHVETVHADSVSEALAVVRELGYNTQYAVAA